MNHYAAEQLARQRHSEFAREAHGGHLIGRGGNAQISGKYVVNGATHDERQSPVRGFGKRLLRTIVRSTRQRTGALNSSRENWRPGRARPRLLGHQQAREDV